MIGKATQHTAPGEWWADLSGSWEPMHALMLFMRNLGELAADR